MFPTRVGTNRRISKASRIRGGVPHAHGDEPEVSKGLNRPVVCTLACPANRCTVELPTPTAQKAHPPAKAAALLQLLAEQLTSDLTNRHGSVRAVGTSDK